MEIMSREYVSIDQSQPVSQLIGKLDGNTSDAACILDGQQLLGVFDPQALLKSRLDIAEIKAARVVKAVPSLTAEDDLQAIALRFYDAKTTMLPVTRDGRVVGVVHVADVLSRIKDSVRGITVRQVRHPRPITVRTDDRIDTALSTLHDEHIDRLPVVDEEGRMVGIISTKDVLLNYYRHHIERDNGQAPKSRTRAFRAELPDLGALPVSNFMSAVESVTISIGEDETIAAAIERMAEQHVLSLFIIDDGKPVGIITKRDILEAFIHAQTEELPNIQYVGLDELDIDSYLKAQVRKIVSHRTGKIEHYFNNEYQLIVHIKEYSKGGGRHKFSVHLRLTYPGSTVPACNADAWNIRTAIQEAFKRIESHLDHQRKRNKRETVSERKSGRIVPG